MIEVFVGYEFDLEGAHAKVTNINQDVPNQTTIYVSNTNVSLAYRAAFRLYFGKMATMYLSSNISWVIIPNTNITCTINRLKDMPV
jgi:hypothetical protein